MKIYEYKFAKMEGFTEVRSDGPNGKILLIKDCINGVKDDIMLPKEIILKIADDIRKGKL